MIVQTLYFILLLRPRNLLLMLLSLLLLLFEMMMMMLLSMVMLPSSAAATDPNDANSMACTFKLNQVYRKDQTQSMAQHTITFTLHFLLLLLLLLPSLPLMLLLSFSFSSLSLLSSSSLSCSTWLRNTIHRYICGQHILDKVIQLLLFWMLLRHDGSTVRENKLFFYRPTNLWMMRLRKSESK